MNIKKQMEIWAGYHLKINSLSGYSSSTVVAKMIKLGGLSSNKLGHKIPKGVDYTDPDILDLVRRVNRAVESLRGEDERAYNILLVYYFSGLRNQRQRSSFFKISPRLFDDYLFKARSWIASILQKKFDFA